MSDEKDAAASVVDVEFAHEFSSRLTVDSPHEMPVPSPSLPATSSLPALVKVSSDSRLHGLLASLPVCDHRAVSELTAVVERVMNDMRTTVEKQVEHWGPWYPRVFQHPLPFDTCNVTKRALMLELLPSVGSNPLYKEVCDAFKFGMSGQTQSGRMVLVTGTSGMGKTKTAYDIGMQHDACVVIMRICERDSPTLPWEACFRLIRQLVYSAPRDQDARTAQKERKSITAILLYLIAAHFEWVLDISKALVDSKGRFGDISAAEVRELWLRVQRNGLAYQSICARFCRKIKEQLQKLGAEQVGEVVELAPVDAVEHLHSLVADARECWTPLGLQRTQLVFAYDEVQALLDHKMHQLDANVCADVYTPQSPAPEADAGVADSGRANQGIFYGLLAALRRLVDGGGIAAHHLLLGNSWGLNTKMMERHSPAQGVTTSIQRTFSLTEADISQLAAKYLRPCILEKLLSSEENWFAKFVGRPLFVAHCFQVLPPHLRLLDELPTPLDDTDAAVAHVSAAVKVAYDAAMGDVKAKSICLMDKSAILVQELLHRILMHRGEVLTAESTHEECKLAVQAGLLNMEPDSPEPAYEAITYQGLEAWGVTQVKNKIDGIMSYLASPLLHAPDVSDDLFNGGVLENCLAWYFVRECIRAGGSVPLSKLLKPLLAVDVTIQAGSNVPGVARKCLPSCIWDDSEWMVSVKGGMIGGKDALPRLANNLDVVIHHTDDNMAGPDIIFVARKGVDEMLVALQVKNRNSGSVRDALASLRWDLWRGEANATALSAKPAWQLPLRCMIGARSYEPALLHAIAWYNTHGMETSPVICLRATASALGVDVGALTRKSYGRAKIQWPECLFPPNVAVRPLECTPSCTVRVRGETRQVVMARLNRLEADPVRNPRILEQPGGTFCAKLEFAHFGDAMRAVELEGIDFDGADVEREDADHDVA